MSEMRYLSLAKRCALKAGEILREGFNRPKHIEYKGMGDPVTEFDRRSEDLIVGMIRERFPDHAILAEESTDVKSSSGVRWIIDPLDGTVNFTHSVPLIAVSIAAEVDGRITAGVIYNPILNDLYEAAEGHGAYHNGRRIRVSAIDTPAKSLVITGFPYRRDRVEEVISPMRLFIEKYEAFRRLGSAAVDMAYIAAGKGEGFYEEGLKPWDTAAGCVIVREAGGIVTDFYGNEYRPENRTILACNPAIHPLMMEVLKNVPEPE